MQHTSCNTHRATHIVQHANATYRHRPCNTHRATHIVQHTSCNMQMQHAHATCNMRGRGRSAASTLQSAFCTVCDAWWLRPLHTARLSCTLHLARCNLHVASCTLHPARRPLHVLRLAPTPHPLHPAHPTYAAHPAPAPHLIDRVLPLHPVVDLDDLDDDLVRPEPSRVP